MTGLPRARRADPDQLPGIQLTPRDGQIMLLAIDYGVVLLRMIALIFNGDLTDAVNSRLRQRLFLLYQHGYLDRAALDNDVGGARYVYMPDIKGRDHVAQMLGLVPADIDWKPRDNKNALKFLPHKLAVNTTRATLEAAARYYNAQIANWCDDRYFRKHPLRVPVQGRSKPVPLIPDGLFLLIQGRQAMGAALEVDRGTEVVRAEGPHAATAKDWWNKALCYLSWYTAGGATQYLPVSSFRVLTVVTTTEYRLRSLMDATAQLGDETTFLYALSEQRVHDPRKVLTKPIWRNSRGDYMQLLTD